MALGFIGAAVLFASLSSGQSPTAATGSSESAPAPSLEGTHWRLVKFEGGDDRVVTPDDPAKYTLEFAAGGRMSARLDCNRGRGTWKANATGQLTLGPLALTRAKCADGSLHDQLVKHWSAIRSFVVKDGHLFLSLMADGGIYEFEPMTKSGARNSSHGIGVASVLTPAAHTAPPASQ